MVIEIGHETPRGTQVVDITKTYPVECQPVGSVYVKNNVAHFDGNGYFHCKMPSFQEVVSKLTEGKMNIKSTCTCKLAYGFVDFTFGTPASNPLFFMPDLQFSAAAQSNGIEAWYTLQVDGAVAESEHFTPNGQMQFGTARFAQVGRDYAPSFSVDNLDLGSHPMLIKGEREIATKNTEFYIGFNPDTGEFLVGQLGSLEVDPGCVGHGGI